MPKSPRDPAYCLHKASGQAYVKLGGKIVYLGPHDSPESKERYHRALLSRYDRTAPAPGQAAPGDVAGLLIAEMLVHYLEFARGYYVRDGQPAEHLQHVESAVRLLDETYGSTPAADFGPKSLKLLRQGLIARGLTRSHINCVVGKLKRFFKWAASEELIPVATYQALATVSGLRAGKSGAREKDPIQPVDDATVQATLPYLPAVVRDLVRIQRLCGARPSEICGLRPADLDRSGDVWLYRLRRHKTEHHGRTRVIPLGPQAQQILEPYLRNRPADAFCFVPAESEAERHRAQRAARQTKVQPSQQNRGKKGKGLRPPGECYDRLSYYKAISRAVQRANRDIRENTPEGEEPKLLEPWGPNRLRHAAATEIRRRFDIEAAQTVLGHAKTDMTERYAQKDLERAVDVARKIG